MSPQNIDYDKSEGKALRLLQLYFHIEEYPGVTAESLCGQFGVSMATLYRDIQSLKKIGVLVTTETTNRGGYCIEGGSIRFMRIRPNEARTLLIAKHLVEKLTLPDEQLFDRLTSQVLGTIREGEVERIQDKLNQYVYFRAPVNRRFNLQATTQVSCLTDLLNAAENHWKVKLWYRRSGEPKERLVHPYGLWFGHNAWYLAAYCESRKTLRTFAVDRIHQVEVQETKTFSRQRDFDLPQWVETSWIATPANTPNDMVTVTIEFDHVIGREVAQAFWHQSQQSQIPEDKTKPVIIQFTLSRQSAATELKSWVASFNGMANILGAR